MKKISKQQGALIEEIGLVIEERAKLTPLAARIYATLILASGEGLTFEEITEAHQASKSAVSNNLKILVNLQYAEYFTKPSQRKRYFKISRFYAKTAMEKYNEFFEKEIEIVKKINSFHQKNNPDTFTDQQSIGMLYQKYLMQLLEGFEGKMKEIKNFEDQLK